MKTKTINIYSYKELSEEAKKKAFKKFYDIDVSYEWWEYTYDNALRIGLKITGFDLGGRNSITGNLTKTVEDVCESIVKEHGASCDTYLLAERTKKELAVLRKAHENDKDGEYALENALEEFTKEFERALLEEYLSLLRQEEEYITSRKAIEETIEANDYEFTEDGRLA